MNTRQKRQENEQKKKKKFILYCTKFKELNLASAHVSVSLNLSGIHENSILMRLQLICEITSCNTLISLQIQYYFVLTKGNKNSTDTHIVETVPLTIHLHAHVVVHVYRASCWTMRRLLSIPSKIKLHKSLQMSLSVHKIMFIPHTAASDNKQQVTIAHKPSTEVCKFRTLSAVCEAKP